MAPFHNGISASWSDFVKMLEFMEWANVEHSMLVVSKLLE